MTRPDFLELLVGGRGAVKGVLMDQSLVAGPGNLLSDEILWRARVAPGRPARGLGRRGPSCVHGDATCAHHRHPRRTRAAAPWLAHGPSRRSRAGVPALRRTAALPPPLRPPHRLVRALPALTRARPWPQGSSRTVLPTRAYSGLQWKSPTARATESDS
ncbi:hypothetical protein ACIRU3_46140 [Streptomyces sp. NPDC101151]|uniref:hypothetical protein n=1 Tax=Streptomyces sp. NPDC101151 TaxID=3366115 RepID=UPI003812957C